MATLVGVLGWWGVFYHGRRRRRRLLYDVSSLLRAWSLLIVCARDSRGARRRATALSSYNPGWDGVVVVVLLDADETHSVCRVCGKEWKWDWKREKFKDLRLEIGQMGIQAGSRQTCLRVEVWLVGEIAIGLA